MKKSLFQKVMCFILSVATLFGVVALTASAAVISSEEEREDRLKDKDGYISSAATLEEMTSVVGTSSYAEYMATFPDTDTGVLNKIPVYDYDLNGNGNVTIEDIVSGAKLEKDETSVFNSEDCKTSFERDQTKWPGFELFDPKDPSLPGKDGNYIYLSATSRATWEFQVPTAGLYVIKIEYYNCYIDSGDGKSSISSIERKLYLDGSIPFDEAGSLNIKKNWGFEYSDDKDGDNVPFVQVSEPEYVGGDDDYIVSYDVVKEGNKQISYKYVTVIKDGYKTVTTYRINSDINGNSMAPQMDQTSKWSTYYCQDSTGYYHGYFNFYLLEGMTHTLTLEAEREPMIVKSIYLEPVKDEKLPSYDEVLGAYNKEGYKAPEGGKVTVLEAEFPDYVSDSSVYATNDNSSAANNPIKSSSQLYNVIGENSYNTVGQWAAYKFQVNKTGLYNLTMRYKQNALQGMYICRTIKLSGGAYGLDDGTPAAPFAEAYNAQFNYDKEWQSTYIGDQIYFDESGNRVNISDYTVNQDGEYVDANGKVVDITTQKRNFEFYFEEGVEYTLYLECSLGSLKELIQRVENSLDKINECYLKILQLTGNDPDKYRDYNFIGIMPEVLYELLLQAIELEAVKQQFEVLCGTNGSHITTLQTIAILLDKMGSREGDDIAANMSTLKSYLGTLGTWINNSKSSSMVVDVIMVTPKDAGDKTSLRRAKAGFFKSIGFEIASFFYSFFTEYDQMGLTTEPDEDAKSIDVWLASGRDQSQIWRTMIDTDKSFTDSTGVAVNLKLVTGGTLLPSILSGKGPDVYMGLGSSDVINYAIRDAVLPVGFSDEYKANLTPDQKIFSSNYYTFKNDEHYVLTYKNADGKYIVVDTNEEYVPKNGEEPFETLTFEEVIGYDIFDETASEMDGNFRRAAMDTVTLLGKTYGIPQTMGFAMMFYRMDVLAELGQTVPESWDELLAILPVLQTNNMSIGVNYISAIDFMIYQKGGNMWKYPDDHDFQGAKVDLDSNVALEAFDFVCRLYSDYSFPVSYDAANRFRTGEMPIIIGDYASIYNQLVVYATEIAGLWEFTSLPGSINKTTGEFDYNSLAGVGATVLLHGCEDTLSAWQFIQWQTGAEAQADYGNKMVALIGPSAKYESANVKALNDLSWTAREKKAIKEQMDRLYSIVNYPGSYIINRYTKFAFLAAVNDGEKAVDALTGYIDAINAEIKRKREEFNLPTIDADQTLEEAKQELQKEKNK